VLVSIIIPVHKLNPFLKECIASVLSQTYNKIEVLIVCNGGLQIEDCKKHLNSLDCRLIFLNSISGRHNARNKGIRVAKGDYVQFLDYDDYLLPNKIERQLKIFISNNEYTLSICKWKKFNKNISEYYILPFDGIFNESILNSQKLYEKLGIYGGFIASSSWLISSKLIQNLEWIDSPNDDAVFLSEVLVRQPNIFMLSEVLAGYRIHNQNESSKRTKEEFDKLIKGWKVIERNIKKFENKHTIQYILKAQLYLLRYSREINNYRIGIILFNIIRLFAKKMLYKK
jgi:glycosyltransferase involved in cell wall biosynthesis